MLDVGALVGFPVFLVLCLLNVGALVVFLVPFLLDVGSLDVFSVPCLLDVAVKISGSRMELEFVCVFPFCFCLIIRLNHQTFSHCSSRSSTSNANTYFQAS